MSMSTQTLERREDCQIESLTQLTLRFLSVAVIALFPRSLKHSGLWRLLCCRIIVLFPRSLKHSWLWRLSRYGIIVPQEQTWYPHLLCCFVRRIHTRVHGVVVLGSISARRMMLSVAIDFEADV